MVLIRTNMCGDEIPILQRSMHMFYFICWSVTIFVIPNIVQNIFLSSIKDIFLVDGQKCIVPESGHFMVLDLIRGILVRMGFIFRRNFVFKIQDFLFNCKLFFLMHTCTCYCRHLIFSNCVEHQT